MKLLSTITAAAVIGASLVSINPAQAFWGNSNKRQIIGYWNCEVKAPGRIGSKGTMHFNSNNNIDMRMVNSSSKDGITFKAQHLMRGDYSIRGKKVIISGTSATENLSSVSGYSYAQNEEFRKEVGQDMPEFRSSPKRRMPQDLILEISAISQKHLILQPEGGSSGEFICRK